ncbi:MAG: Octanoate-[acyl-carrier-protein]-protein-N-octanoyltransferase [Myxococcaceae bacterium]|nr:Octanoate-[acyl-carrier-protein]-protein-N-octanoyltransferase [Myxococcaceae bacterium]
MSTRALTAHRLGRIAYADAHALQERLVAARKQGQIGDTLLLLEHPKVITLGRAAKRENILLSEAELSDGAYEVFETGRGGDVTFHGPGQLVGYPILDLAPDRQDVRRYVSDLEQTMIDVCSDYGISAERVAGFNGTWVGMNKVGAVGVRISRWVTMHGFALNVNTALEDFGAIVPCGIRGRGVTSLSHELSRTVSLHEVETRAAERLAARLSASLSFREGAP